MRRHVYDVSVSVSSSDDFEDTHLPKALRLFSLVPYLSANAAASAVRSASHSLAAFLNSAASSASCSSAACSFALAFSETHLPKALPWRLSALHSFAAFV